MDFLLIMAFSFDILVCHQQNGQFEQYLAALEQLS